MSRRIGVRREDLDKRSEMRVAVTPTQTAYMREKQADVLVQSGIHVASGTNKRAFSDQAYIDAGATVQEDLSSADIIFGLKEIKPEGILPNKPYLFFSHTHKGQTKNRPMLRILQERQCTVIDYELITDENGQRLLTAFTYFAGYGGMIDSLWAFGQRAAKEGVDHPFATLPQSIEKGDLNWFKQELKGPISEAIVSRGTPASMPPLITCILGCGKTSKGAQDIYQLLPTETITLDQLADVYQNGSRNKVYQLVLEVYDMYRLTADADISADAYAAMDHGAKFQHYIEHPECYESNLDRVLPYCSMLMNCILWSPRYPRVLSNELMASFPETLRVIGDITCDPNGAIEFSKETWVDDPVYTFLPSTQTDADGVDLAGVQVMAVTNLPCAFSADASAQFASELQPLLDGLLTADFEASFEEAGLPNAIKRATLLWRGELTPAYAYMSAYLESSQNTGD